MVTKKVKNSQKKNLLSVKLKGLEKFVGVAVLESEEKGHGMRDRWIKRRTPRGSITGSGTHINHIPPTQVFSSRSLEAHTYTPNLFLLITPVTAVQPPLIITLRQIISFIRSIMTYCHYDWWHTMKSRCAPSLPRIHRKIQMQTRRETNVHTNAKPRKHPTWACKVAAFPWQAKKGG